MNLNSLVGLTLGDAEDLVRRAGLVPDSLAEFEATNQLALAANVVRLRYNEADNTVLSVETQASIDASYTPPED